MNGHKSIYFQKLVLDMAFGNTSKPAWTNLYFALFTTNPTDSSDTATEVSGGSYARVSVTNNSTNFPSATHSGSSPASKKNATAIQWPTASASWGVITGIGIYSASTSGNLLYWCPITPTFTVNATGSFKVDANKLTITEF